MFSRLEKDGKLADKQDPFFCPICSVDLTNDQDRQTHVNQCLDKGFSSKAAKKPPKPKPEPKPKSVEEEKVEEERVAKKVPELSIEDAVPNCPICGKVLMTLNVALNIVSLII